jgi:osmoprotectant transport system ATP-binding protein
MSAVVFEHAGKRYNSANRPAVDDCSLTVDDGQFVVLLGPSGCGKTTLLKMVNRLIEPSSGRILVNDVDVRSLSVTDLRRRIGYVIQQVGLFPHMTVEANIAVVPRLLHWSKARISERIDVLLELVGLSPRDYRGRRPRELSGGEQQRVGIARAMAADQSLLLMDEPFGAIDAINRTRLQDELLRIQAAVHKTVLFVTHDVEEALRLADVLVVMRDGKIVQAAPPRSILTHSADEFVAKLVGSDDVLRRLSLIPIVELMTPLRATTDGRSGLIAIDRSENARNALSLLLREGVRAVGVTDGQTVIGSLTIHDLEEALQEARPVEEKPA